MNNTGPMKSIKEQSEYQSSVFQGTMKLGSDLNLLDEEDAEFRAFQERKMTIMTNITHLVKQKYQSD